MTQEVVSSADGNMREFKVYDNEHTAHWELFRKGYASMRVQTNIKNAYLSFDTHEHGEKSVKRTMVTMDAEHGRALYDWLKSIYEPTP